MPAIARHAKIDADHIQKRRIGQRDALYAEIRCYAKFQTIAPRTQRRQIGAAPVGVGGAAEHRHAGAIGQHQRDTRRRYAMRGAEHMGGQRIHAACPAMSRACGHAPTNSSREGSGASISISSQPPFALAWGGALGAQMASHAGFVIGDPFRNGQWASGVDP